VLQGGGTKQGVLGSSEPNDHPSGHPVERVLFCTMFSAQESVHWLLPSSVFPDCGKTTKSANTTPLEVSVLQLQL
jgi:hypothetical protein